MLNCSYYSEPFWNGSFYDRTDGVAMGSPLALVLAKIFM